jgi:excinuclease ABC subunit A
LKKLAQKYGMDEDKLWKDMPERFTDVVMNGDDELLRLGMTGQYMSMTYKGVKDVLTGQYHKGILTVDFQAMFDMVPCHECGGSKLRKESLYVYLHTGKPENKPHNIKTDDMSEMVTIFDLQKIPMVEMITILEAFEANTDKPVELIDRILGPLLDRARTINNLGLGYINISRPIDTLSGGEIQRLRLAKQL